MTVKQLVRALHKAGIVFHIIPGTRGERFIRTMFFNEDTNLVEVYCPITALLRVKTGAARPAYEVMEAADTLGIKEDHAAHIVAADAARPNQSDYKGTIRRELETLVPLLELDLYKKGKEVGR